MVIGKSISLHMRSYLIADSASSALRIATEDVQSLLHNAGLKLNDEDVAVYRSVFDGVNTCAEDIMSMDGRLPKMACKIVSNSVQTTSPP